jgi:hypothetical protein
MLLVVSALYAALLGLIAFWGWVWLQVSRASPESFTAQVRFAAKLTGWIVIGYALVAALSLLYVGTHIFGGPSIAFH